MIVNLTIYQSNSENILFSVFTTDLPKNFQFFIKAQ